MSRPRFPNAFSDAKRAAPIPNPISVLMTVREAANVHVVLTWLIKNVEEGVALKGLDLTLTNRAVKELEKKLKAAGCVLDERGWSV